MPLSHLCLLIYLTPTLQPDVVCPVQLHTQTVHSFKVYLFRTCLWPGRIPDTRPAMRRQTITPVLGEQKLYQRPNTSLLRPPPPALPSSAHWPALQELQPKDMVPSEHLLSKKVTLWTHCPSASCTQCPVSCTYHHLKWPRHLHHLSVPGHVTTSVKEGPSCPHTLSAEFSPQIPVTAAWKDSPDGCGAGARWGPRGWAHLGHSVVRVGRDLPVPAWTRRQADQLPSPWDHEGARLSSLLRVVAAQEELSVLRS